MALGGVYLMRRGRYTEVVACVPNRPGAASFGTISQSETEPGMLGTRGHGVVLGVVALAALASPAVALINPNFTPVHLTEQSELILLVRLKGEAGAKEPTLEVLEALKGAKPTGVSLDMTAAPKQHVEAARKRLAACAGQPLLLFAGRYQGRLIGYLHVGGVWFLLGSPKNNRWGFEGLDSGMAGTWAGGTDMLLRCVRYILSARGDADVPVTAGTAWRSIRRVGQARGKLSGIRAVDPSGKGRAWLHLASPDGDVLLQPVAGKETFRDATGQVGLKARSVVSAWGDFNGDGRADLASFDGKALNLWVQGADGRFSSIRPAGANVPPGCTGLELIGLGEAGTPALVAGGAHPTVLKLVSANTFRAVSLAAPAKVKVPALGKPQACLVADFTNDSFPDILQAFEKGGLLYVGRGDGGFDSPKPCGVGATVGGGRLAVGDFDADGWADVLTAGTEGVRVFQNLHDGTFRETLAESGEVAYKTQPDASWCGVCDFNNDARQDLFITYGGQSPLLYFNRGFRSFGEAPKLELALEEIEALPQGQQMGVFADFDVDGAEDFVVVLNDGQVWCAYNDLGGEDALCIRPRLVRRAGPVGVRAWDGKRLLGVWQVRFGLAPVLVGIPEAGEYRLSWRAGGGKQSTRKLIVEDRPVEVVLDSPGAAGGKHASRR